MHEEERVRMSAESLCARTTASENEKGGEWRRPQARGGGARMCGG